jgi:hypothetical protein
MLNCLLEQKRAVSVYVAEYDDKSSEILSMTTSQWSLATRIVEILQPFDQLTHEISCIKKIISELTASLTRFSCLYENNMYMVLAGLDPRFKLHSLTTMQQVKAKTDIVTATIQCQPKFSTATAQPHTAIPVADEQPPTKKQKKNFWSSWDQLQLVQAHNNELTITI